MQIRLLGKDASGSMCWAQTSAKATTTAEGFMSASKVLAFSEPTGTMTFAEGLAFIERTRRQLDRFEDLPLAPGQTIAPDDAGEIRRMCDDLEADINSSLSGT
jgi:hypothetical protein